MNSKKGFTLIELLAVISILAVLMCISIPSYITISNDIKESMWKTKQETIANALDLWAADNKSSCEADISNLTIDDLLQKAYLNYDDNAETFVNPYTKESIIGEKVCSVLGSDDCSTTFCD